LVEILIAILILGVGLASLATLFPIGLLRLRDAARSTRSAYLMESAAADLAARGLLTNSSFNYADQFNLNYNFSPWYWVLSGNNVNLSYPHNWSPLTQDTAFYGDDPRDPNARGANSPNSGGYGLPFAYDPLWRYQTVGPNGTNGYYLDPINRTTLEARFGAGLGFLQPDPSHDGNPPSAHGLQRITNFNRPYVLNNNQVVPIMPVANGVPNIFVSPEDVVWVENLASSTFSPVLPDMTLAKDLSGNPTSINDWRYSWMFTGQQNNSSATSSFEGNIVIFESRPFGITAPSFIPNPPAPGPSGGTFQVYQVAGETVVEAIFGYSTKVASYGGTYGFGVSADRAVLLRWYASEPDPVVRVGDWIADVTYERNAFAVVSRFQNFQQYTGPNGTPIQNVFGGLQNPYDNGEWDNLPAQRCYWYRVQKVVPATADSALGAGFRSMVVYVDRSLQARTVLSGTGQPSVLNAALICPSVVNVIPQTIFTK
jgi:hypothetical protein